MEIMKKYKVLWFDDEFETLDIIKEEGKLNGILLFGYNNASEGIEELRIHIEDYDAVIVDGKFYDKPGQSGDALNDQALFNVGVTLESLRDKKKIPWFILSGQISFTKEKNRYADGFKDNKVYDKTVDEDINSLWKDLKNEADKQFDTQLRHKYQRVLDICTEIYIGEEAGRKLFNAIKIIESDSEVLDTEDFFNSVRKVIEKLFVSFNKIGILPDDIIRQNGWLNNSSKFLCGSHPYYKIKDEFIPPTISFVLKHIMLIIQDASHSEGSLSLKIEDHVRMVSSSNLYKSVVYQLFDIILWFKLFSDKHPDVEFNKSMVLHLTDNTNIDSSGVIEQDNYGNYHCGEFLLNATYVTNNNYKVGDIVQIKESSENTQVKSKHLYPRFGSKFIRL